MTAQNPCRLREKDLADIEAVRALFLTMLAEERGPELIELCVRLLAELRDRNTALTARLMKALRQLYKPASEKVDSAQLELVLSALTSELPAGTKQDETASEPAAEPSSSSPQPPPAPPAPPPRRGRKPLPESLPRERVRLEPVAEALVCSQCNASKMSIGQETSSVLEFVPAGFKVIVYERAKYACKACAEGVVVAPAADKVIEGGLPGPGLVAHVLVSKYWDACPLNRLSGIYDRHGVAIATSTLGDWVAAGADMLEPLAKEIRRRVLGALVVSLDDTGLRVLDREHPKGAKRGHMWAYVGDNELVAYAFTPTWQSQGVQAFLAGRKGYIQGDGYAGYKALFAGPDPPVQLGCMAHLRRKFHDAMEAKDTRAAVAVAMIQELYAIERQATQDGVHAEERTRRRQTQSRTVLERLRLFIDSVAPAAPPKSPLGKAVTYALRQWPTLVRFVDDGRLPLDTNHVERLLRNVAVGRKNWLFAGSDQGAHRAAIVLTVLGSAFLAGIRDVWAYLREVLAHLSSGWPAARLGELLPAAWAEQKRQHTDAQQMVAAAP